MQHFECQCALAGHHIRVVVGVNKKKILLLGQQQGVCPCLVQRVAVQDHIGTEVAGALHLDAGRQTGHDNHRAQPQALCMVSHALGVITRAHGNHTARTFLRRELCQLVAGAAFLEGGGELQVLKLQKDLGAGDVRQRLGGHTGRAQHVLP